MKPFQTLTSMVIPLDIKDVDTDMIIPATYLTSTSEGGYGKNVFQRLRDERKDFPLNLAKYQDAKIIMAQDNFGCGSSREHAVWALMEYGIQVIIAPSFADIFQSNAGKNGLVLVALPQDVINAFIREQQEREEPREISVNLENQLVTFPDGSEHHFFFDPFRKDCILKGHEDLDYLLEHISQIEDWQQERENKLFYKTTERNH